MFLPVNVDVPMSRLPIANWAVIALVACTSFAGWANDSVFDSLAGFNYHTDIPAITPNNLTAEQLDTILDRLKKTGAVHLGPERVFDPPAWKLPILALTSTLLHADVFHLAGNLLFLWAFGNAVNYKFGHLGFLALYLAAAFLGGMAFYLTVPGIPVIGASAAIMGMMGAFLVFFPRNQVMLVPANLTILRYWSEPIYISSWVAIILWIGLDTIQLLRGTPGPVAHDSHVIGFAVGFSTAAAVAWLRLVRPTRYEQTLLQVLGLS